MIIPIHNGSPWIQRCFGSILSQTALNTLPFEICICDDASTDNTKELLNEWSNIFLNKGIKLTVFKNRSGTPKGVGYAKNKAVAISRGKYLCFQDVVRLF